MSCFNHWYALREWNTRNFKVALEWGYENDPDVSWADAETLEALESGALTNYSFRVVVYWNGVIVGRDYLGNSIYADAADFAREHIGLAAKSRADGCNYGAYLPGMVSEAIREARKELARVFADVPNVRAA